VSNRKQIINDLQRLQDKINSEGLVDFLGLSPDQMYQLVYGNIDDLTPIITFNTNFDRALLDNVPVVNQLLLLISLIGEAGEAKATKNGFLPKKIVNAVHKIASDRQYTVQSEEDQPTILVLRYAATDCGWIKKRSGKFSLTKKGEQILKNGFLQKDYVRLLKYWLREYLWSFADGFSECLSIQKAAFFSLYILEQKAQQLLPSKTFAELFITAFPFAVDEIEPSLYSSKPGRDEVAFILRLRFFRRFAAYFGLVDYVVDKDLPYFSRDEQSHVKTTILFQEVLYWFSEEKQKSGQARAAEGDDLLH
jgi:hypothetical protein